MGKINKVLDQLRSAAGELLATVNELDSRIAACHQRRDALTSAIVSKSEYMDYIKADIARRGRTYAKSLADEIAGKRRDYGTLERNKASGVGERLPYLTGRHSIPVVITEEAIFWHFGDMIAAGIEAAIDDMPWGDTVATADERAKALTALEKEITELTQERDALAQQLTEAGLAG